MTTAKPSNVVHVPRVSGFGGSQVNIVESLVQQQYQSGSGFSAAFTTRALHRGQHLYWPGDLSTHVYSVNRGVLKTYRPGDDGREQITGFPSAGKLLGLDTLMDRPMRCGAVALEETLVCRIPVQVLVIGSGESRQLRLQLLEQFDNEIARLEVQLSLYCLAAPQRLADFILFMAGTSSDVHLPMSHKDIGNYLRLVPETVSRLLKRFRRSGWVTMHGHGIAIVDRPALEHIAADLATRFKPEALAAR